ncbi:MAG TPA: metallophosphoesterase [Candidatus Acidoferrales bacterium]|nr:metallophosphoesterase [Candidatus Acidoferrales bacterium]
MARICRFAFVLLLLMSYPFFGCGSGSGTNPADTFQVVAFSDVHFNPFYDTSLFPALLAADPSQWASIFQTSTITTPSAWNTDSNYPLLVLALAAVKQSVGASPVVLYTGDLIGHNFQTTFYQLDGDPLPPSPAATAAMQAFTDKTVAFVTQQVRLAVGNAPVMFAVGNIDSYTGYGPDSVFLANNAESYYTRFLNSTVDRTTFLSTFTSGGYYSAAVGTNLLVIGLNTNPFSPLVPGNNQPAVNAENAWLDTTLTAAKAAGQKVWILMHVPPGADEVTTASKADINGHITTASATMMWVQNYQTSFLQTLANHPGVITLVLAAHTHMDEFRVLSPNIVMDQVPGITPVFGNDPAFKVFTFDTDTLTPTDYRSLNYDLAALPAQFSTYYDFSAAYGIHGPLNSSLAQLNRRMLVNGFQQAIYSGLYQSGHNSANPITATTWPIFACGVGNMDQADLISCVNSY